MNEDAVVREGSRILGICICDPYRDSQTLLIVTSPVSPPNLKPLTMAVVVARLVAARFV